MSIRCELCNVNVPTGRSQREHYQGRQHQMATEKAAIAQRSIYVRGFPPQQVKEEDLKALFEQFGTVEKASLDTAKRCFAFVEFTSVAGALGALQHPKVLKLYGKKLVVKPREFKPAARKGHETDELAMDISVHGNSEVPHIIGGIHLPEEVHAKLEQTMSVEEQLQVLTTGCRMPDTILETHLSLCHHLHSIFQEVFHRCIIVPFGAAISGNATLSSDCDLCLITEPTEHDQHFLTGQNYYSTKDLAVWERLLAASTGLVATPALPPLSHNEGSSPHPSKILPQQLKVVQTIVQSIPGCSHIQPIPSTRCPIVRFQYMQIHCDLSVDNRLGPYNTRLLKSYYEFDPRVLPLVVFIRLWARACGIKRTQLSSYAISLMVVYALQNTTPPVLPCLQDPRGWPKDMQKLATQGFTVTSSAPVIVDGWTNDFTSPSTLLPSTNTASTMELLLHFFQFYAQHFDFSNHVIAVHNPPIEPLTILEAIKLARTHIGEQQPRDFKLSPVCIQDPFELSHNVTKSLVPANLLLLQSRLRCAAHITHQQLQREVSTNNGNLLALFHKQEILKISAGLSLQESEFSTKIIILTTANVVSLLKRVESLKPLASRLSDLDLTNPEIIQKLTLVVLKALTAILEQYLSFVCQPVHEEARIGSFATELSTPPATVNPLQEDSQPAMEVGDRESRKRQRAEQQTEPCDESPHLEDPKKVKLASTSTALDLLYSATSGMAPVYMCTTHANTWFRRRGVLRQRKRERLSMNKLKRDTLLPQTTPSDPMEATTPPSQTTPSDPMEATTPPSQITPSDPMEATTPPSQITPSDPMEDTTPPSQTTPSDPMEDTTPPSQTTPCGPTTTISQPSLNVPPCGPTTSGQPSLNVPPCGPTTTTGQPSLNAPPCGPTTSGPGQSSLNVPPCGPTTSGPGQPSLNIPPCGPTTTGQPSSILEPENPSILALAHSLPDIPPILQFLLSAHTTAEPGEHITTVSLKIENSYYTVVFSEFFAYFKQLVMRTYGQVAL